MPEYLKFCDQRINVSNFLAAAPAAAAEKKEEKKKVESESEEDDDMGFGLFEKQSECQKV